MTPYRIALLALLASISLGWSSVWAEDLTGTLKKIKDSGEITIGNRESSVPFSYLDEHGIPVGYSVDLCKTVVDEVKTPARSVSSIFFSMKPTAAFRAKTISLEDIF